MLLARGIAEAARLVSVLEVMAEVVIMAAPAVTVISILYAFATENEAELESAATAGSI